MTGIASSGVSRSVLTQPAKPSPSRRDGSQIETQSPCVRAPEAVDGLRQAAQGTQRFAVTGDHASGVASMRIPRSILPAAVEACPVFTVSTAKTRRDAGHRWDNSRSCAVTIAAARVFPHKRRTRRHRAHPPCACLLRTSCEACSSGPNSGKQTIAHQPRARCTDPKEPSAEPKRRLDPPSDARTAHVRAV